jgi:hypothetical protein
MNETDLSTKILNFLLENGETRSRDVKILSTNKKTIDSNLIRMFETGILCRRKIEKKFAYSIRDREDFYLNGEPGYAYYLRNLPRSAVTDQVAA